MLGRKSTVDLGNRSTALVQDPFGFGLTLEIKSAEDPKFREWKDAEMPPPEVAIRRIVAQRTKALSAGARRGKGGKIKNQDQITAEATEMALNEVDLNPVPEITELKPGLPLLFNIRSGADELGNAIEDTEAKRLELLREGEGKDGKDSCFPAAFEDEERTVPVWHVDDVYPGDHEIPFGGRGTHYAGRDPVEVRRPTVGSCIALWIYTTACELAEGREIEVAEAAADLGPTQDGGSASEDASSPTS